MLSEYPPITGRSVDELTPDEFPRVPLVTVEE